MVPCAATDCLPSTVAGREYICGKYVWEVCVGYLPTLNCCLSSSITSPVLSGKEDDSSLEALLHFFAALTGVSCVRADLMCVCVCVCLCVYTRARAHTHTHTHRPTFSLASPMPGRRRRRMHTYLPTQTRLARGS